MSKAKRLAAACAAALGLAVLSTNVASAAKEGFASKLGQRGDQLLLEATAVRVKSRTGHVRCKAFVEDRMACEADIKFMLVDAEPV